MGVGGRIIANLLQWSLGRIQGQWSDAFATEAEYKIFPEEGESRIIRTQSFKIHPFMIKVLREIRDTRNIPKYNQGTLQQTNSQHQTKWREIQSDPTEIRNNTRLSNLSISIQYSSWDLARAIDNKRRSKRQTVIFANDMIVYISNPKISTKELLQLINTYSM